MHIVSDSGELAQLCTTFAEAPYVTVDTEFLRERTYWSQLCLVQLARPGEGLNWLDGVALVVGIGAPVLQFVADAQMRAFIRVRQPGQAMEQGLWAWSRHPNYFGEVAFWWSLALFGIAGAPGDWWWLVVGGVAMTVMFEAASIPMMEKRSLERRPTYQDVIDRVPRLVPRPPRRRTPA